MNLSELIWGAAGLVLTVMILSYLAGDNFLFRLAAYLFVGVTAGFLTVLIVNQVLWPHLLQPLISGTWEGRLWAAIPLIFALLLTLSQFSRFSGAGRIPLAFLSGVTAAIVIGGAVFGTMIPQVRSVVNAFDPAGWYAMPGLPWLRILEAVLMLIGVVATLSYFHFGRRRQKSEDHLETARPRVFEAMSKVGEVFMGVALGAVFTGIFSTALLAMIDRLLFIGEFVIQLLGGR